MFPTNGLDPGEQQRLGLDDRDDGVVVVVSVLFEGGVVDAGGFWSGRRLKELSV